MGWDEEYMVYYCFGTLFVGLKVIFSYIAMIFLMLYAIDTGAIKSLIIISQ